jgi:predicted Zn finger-like uncharacterized protein
MPVQTACTSCAAKLKVKDELVGKSIKCPKCGKVFKVAGEADGTAVKAGVAASATKDGAVKSAPAAEKPAKKPPPPPPRLGRRRRR